MALLDHGQVDSMAEGATATFLGIVERFHVSSRESLAGLEALMAEDPGAAAGVVHQLKGASGTLGLAEFHRRAAACEAGLKQGAVPGSGEVPALCGLLEESVMAVRAYLGGAAE